MVNGKIWFQSRAGYALQLNRQPQVEEESTSLKCQGLRVAAEVQEMSAIYIPEFRRNSVIHIAEWSGELSQKFMHGRGFYTAEPQLN